MGKTVRGIVMIAVFLAFWYLVKKEAILSSFSPAAQTGLLVVGALVIFIGVELLFSVKEKGIAGALKGCLPIIIGAAVFFCIFLVINKFNLNADILVYIVVGVCLLGALYGGGTFDKVKDFLGQSKKSDDEE